MSCRGLRTLLAACLVGLTCAAALTAAPAALAAVPSGFQDTIAIDGLKEPTSIRFSPDGRVFVAEKAGRILVYASIDDPSPEVFADLRKQTFDANDRGLLGLALDPSFPSSPYVYALYTFDHVLGEDPPGFFPRWGQPPKNPGEEGWEGDGCSHSPEVDACPVSGRLVRITAEGNHAAPTAAAPAEKVLVEDWCQQNSSHSIGDLAFGPEGALFASGGEGASFIYPDYGQAGWPSKNQCGDPPSPRGTALSAETGEGGSLRSQDVVTSGDPTGLDGTVIRIDPASGEGLPGNPLYGDIGADANARRIVATGFRNPFRFSINAETDEVYVDNVGNGTNEEIDRFSTTPTGIYNSGWPCYEGDTRNPDFNNFDNGLCESLYAKPGSTSPPFFSYLHGQPVTTEDKCDSSPGAAISGSTFYDGNAFPAAYDQALFFADPVRGCAFVMFAGADGRPDPATTTPFLTNGGLYPGIDFEVGPDGALYYVQLFGNEYSDPGSIHRITYFSGNEPPVARLTATPEWSAGNLKARFDAAGSSDAEGGALSYEWDLEGDGTYAAPSSNPVREKEFKDSQNHVVAVRVVDQSGARSVDRVTVYPHDTPPEPAILEPGESAPGSGIAALNWRVGQAISFKGVAEDGEDGTLLPTRLDWSSRLFHCPSACHAHPLQAFPSVSKGTLVAPDHDYPSYIDLTFTAVDSRGLAASTTIKLDPRTVELMVDSEPTGITLTAGLLTQPGPIALTSIEGSNVILSAPPTAQLASVAYSFQGWSDGGARVHSLIANGSATYTANYVESPGPPAPPNPSDPPKTPVTPVQSGGAGGGSQSPAAKSPPPLSRPALGLHPPKRTASSAARFEFESPEAGVGYACKLDDGPLVPCNSPRVYRKLKPGEHVFRVVAEAPGESVEYSAATVFRWRVLANDRAR
jgi:glucose/arabinose dehydrogenase